MVPVKGCPLEMPKSPLPPARGPWTSEAVDCRCFTALSILAIVTGTNPAGRLLVEGAPDPGGPWAPLAAPFLLTDTQALNLPTGAPFARLRLDGVTGTFGPTEGFRFWVTPYAGPFLSGPPPLKVARIDISTLGDATIVPAVTGRRIKVCAYVVIAKGTVDLTWKSGTTALSGPLPLAASTGAAPSVQPPAYLLATSPGESLILGVAGATPTQVSGHLSYWDTDEV